MPPMMSRTPSLPRQQAHTELVGLTYESGSKDETLKHITSATEPSIHNDLGFSVYCNDDFIHHLQAWGK